MKYIDEIFVFEGMWIKLVVFCFSKVNDQKSIIWTNVLLIYQANIFYTSTDNLHTKFGINWSVTLLTKLTKQL